MSTSDVLVSNHAVSPEELADACSSAILLVVVALACWRAATTACRAATSWYIDADIPGASLSR